MLNIGNTTAYQEFQELFPWASIRFNIALVASSLSQTSKKYFANNSFDNGVPLILIRSRTSSKCGDVYNPKLL